MPIFKLLARSSEPPKRQLKKNTLIARAFKHCEPPNRQLILGLEASNGNDKHRSKAAIVLNPPRFLGGFFLLCYVNSIGEDELVCLRAPAGVIMNTHFT